MNLCDRYNNYFISCTTYISLLVNYHENTCTAVHIQLLSIKITHEHINEVFGKPSVWIFTCTAAYMHVATSGTQQVHSHLQQYYHCWPLLFFWSTVLRCLHSLGGILWCSSQCSWVYASSLVYYMQDCYWSLASSHLVVVVALQFLL